MPQTVAELIAGFHSGDRRSLSRLISYIENEDGETAHIIKEIYPKTGRAHIIGVTGAPGVGKSTLVDKLVGQFRRGGKKVGVIAVDPTSPFTGGALLGDRIRMSGHAGDDGVFIRSMGSRGSAGGITRTTSDVAKLLDAFGFDVVIIETVGAGQSEVAVADIGDTLVVVTSPGLGDDIQFLKAGILEIGDIFIVNKGDMEGADQTVADLEMMLGTGKDARHGDWKTAVLKTVAKRDDESSGVAGAVRIIESHMEHLKSAGKLEPARQEQCKRELIHIAQRRLTSRLFCELEGGGAYGEIADRVARRKADPYSAAEEMLGLCGLNKQ